MAISRYLIRAGLLGALMMVVTLVITSVAAVPAGGAEEIPLVERHALLHLHQITPGEGAPAPGAGDRASLANHWCVRPKACADVQRSSR